MHALRWAIYIEERGWAALRAKQAVEGFERDEYDDALAHYLLAIDDDASVLGAMRLRPASGRSLMADHFPQLIEGPQPPHFDEGDWELTRLLRAPLCRSREGSVRFAMNCALIEFCMAHDVRRLIATAETFLLPMTRKAWGPKVRPLGLPQPYDEGEVIALALFPDAEALAAMRRAGAVSDTQLYQHRSLHNPVEAAARVSALRAAAHETSSVEAA
jgi:N-acyl-L-homoserine lactone synthetase